jgi:DNA modification methylase
VPSPQQRKRRAPKRKRRGNLLDGRTWTRYSISVWSDIQKTPEELKLKHPALFPAQLAKRVIECFLPPKGKLVLDPFCGLGSTVLAAHALGRLGIGLDINPDYIALAQKRLGDCEDGCLLLRADANDLLDHVQPGSVDLVVTSPPYWDILTRRRSADRKAVRNYGDRPRDLGRVSDYRDFLAALAQVFDKVKDALRPGAYCVVVVMDLRKGKEFHPFHSDLAAKMQEIGYLWDDLIIWDRRREYNNLRPLGYPSVFRINKAHEYLLIFQKPR